MVEAGHEVVHARDVGLRSAPDATVLLAALDGARVLVTLDTDFGALIAHSGSQLPSVVLFRGEVTRQPSAQAEVLLANLEQFAVDLVQGAVVVIEMIVSVSDASRSERFLSAGAAVRYRRH